MKIGIIGGHGMLGRDLTIIAESRGFEVTLFDHPIYDITRSSDIEHIVEASDVIINCAAYTAVDQAEIDIENAYAVNAYAVKKLGECAAKSDKYILHVSTDFVFGDSSSKPHNESSNTNPLNIYGKSKLKGEILLEGSGAKHAVIRIQWTYGINGNNFIAKLIELASKLDELKVVDDQIGAPTPTVEVSKAILCLVDKRAEGLYHFASRDYASRYEVACEISGILNLKNKLIPCSSDLFPAPARRPENSRFDCSKIDKILDFERRDWKALLKEYLLKYSDVFISS